MMISRRVWGRNEPLSKSEHEERLRKIKEEIILTNECLPKLHITLKNQRGVRRFK